MFLYANIIFHVRHKTIDVKNDTNDIVSYVTWQ